MFVLCVGPRIAGFSHSVAGDQNSMKTRGFRLTPWAPAMVVVANLLFTSCAESVVCVNIAWVDNDRAITFLFFSSMSVPVKTKNGLIVSTAALRLCLAVSG